MTHVALSAAHLLHSLAQPWADPSPQPNINNDTVQAGATPLIMLIALLAAVVLLALSMRKHLRKVPTDLSVPTRARDAATPDGADAAPDGQDQ